ncbi:uncharacterized protein [Dermacentor albipictus]|uniref:uncharacterized protein isoform X3 n=1 Tax=Dermacentor albipictus TaxID=60249 RepID=UPI0031FC8650
MTDNSYAVQHFSVSPMTIVNGVYDIWFDYTGKCLDDLKTALQDKASGRIPADMLGASVEPIFQEMVPEFNKNADKLECTKPECPATSLCCGHAWSSYIDITQASPELLMQDFMQHMTHVPSHVLLPEDDVHRQFPDERRPSVSSLRAQLGSLHRRIAQGRLA